MSIILSIQFNSGLRYNRGIKDNASIERPFMIQQQQQQTNQWGLTPVYLFLFAEELNLFERKPKIRFFFHILEPI